MYTKDNLKPKFKVRVCKTPPPPPPPPPPSKRILFIWLSSCEQLASIPYSPENRTRMEAKREILDGRKEQLRTSKRVLLDKQVDNFQADKMASVCPNICANCRFRLWCPRQNSDGLFLFLDRCISQAKWIGRRRTVNFCQTTQLVLFHPFKKPRRFSCGICHTPSV